jgi:hypothetical protein
LRDNTDISSDETTLTTPESDSPQRAVRSKWQRHALIRILRWLIVSCSLAKPVLLVEKFNSLLNSIYLMVYLKRYLELLMPIRFFEDRVPLTDHEAGREVSLSLDEASAG